MEKNLGEIFREIYENESDGIFRFCLLRVSNREQSLDITQEAFLRLWKNLLNEEKISNPRAFLFTITRNLIIDWYRKKKNISLDKMIDNEIPFDLPDEKTVNFEMKAEGRYLIQEIKNLEEKYREPVYLRFVEDLSPQEIGKILGISENATSVRISRGIEELRKLTGYKQQ